MFTARSFIAAACIAFSGGCAAAPASEPSNPASTEGSPVAKYEVDVRLGQTASIEPAGLTVTLLAIDSDSRCPKGETCAWEGDATVRLRVTGTGGSNEIVLHTSRRAGTASAIQDRWKVELAALEPYPVTGRAIAQDEYVATLRALPDEAPGATQ